MTEYSDKENYKERLSGVIAFYDRHPINEEQILSTLERQGIALENLTENVLKDYDQDHFGGVRANEILAEMAKIEKNDHILDICSGLGGPSRYFADKIGCRVTGVDLTESRVYAAIRLTQLTNLSHLVDFQIGNALDLPFENGLFDTVIGQEAWAHIPNKDKLISEGVRVLKQGGNIAFTDIIKTRKLKPSDAEILSNQMLFNDLQNSHDYTLLLERNNCEIIKNETLGEEWLINLEKRHKMYQSLEEETVTAFGQQHFQRWNEAYEFFVSLYREEKLSGLRCMAKKR